MSEEIKSLNKALVILELLADYPDGIALQDIAKHTGFNKTSIHRVLSTFESTGYVTQIKNGRDYRLSMKLLHLGQTALRSDVTGIVKPYLLELLDSIQETVNFLTFDNDNIIFKDKLEPRNASFRTRTYVGMYSPLYCTAAGKCYLAYVSNQVREDYWQRNESLIKPLTTHTILDKPTFFAHLDEIKERGFAIDDEENEAGISCVAVPIFDKSGIPNYAISISSLTPKMAQMGQFELAKKIKVITKKIEEDLF